MESSHIPLHKWMCAFYLESSSKKGISAHQLHRALGITYKSAWFLHHRVMEAMRSGGLATPMGGEGQVVEADETYIGRKKGSVVKRGTGGHKNAVVSLVERGGNVRSFHVPRADKATVAKIVTDNIHRKTRLHTDESRPYGGTDGFFILHARHSLELRRRYRARCLQPSCETPSLVSAGDPAAANGLGDGAVLPL